MGEQPNIHENSRFVGQSEGSIQPYLPVFNYTCGYYHQPALPLSVFVNSIARRPYFGPGSQYFFSHANTSVCQ